MPWNRQTDGQMDRNVGVSLYEVDVEVDGLHRVASVAETRSDR